MDTQDFKLVIPSDTYLQIFAKNLEFFLNHLLHLLDRNN